MAMYLEEITDNSPSNRKEKFSVRMSSKRHTLLETKVPLKFKDEM